MKFTHLLAAMCCAVSMISCGEENQSDLFDYSKPVDLSTILQATRFEKGTVESVVS